MKNKWQILYKGKNYFFDENPRSGVCEHCGKIKGRGWVFHLHHENYDSDDPLANTVELCPSCHHKIHKLLK